MTKLLKRFAPALLIAAGCGSTLTVNVRRYNVDANDDAKAAYRNAQTQTWTAGQRAAALFDAQSALAEYRKYLVKLNAVVVRLMADAKPSETAAANEEKIDRILKPVADALASELAGLPGQPNAPAAFAKTDLVRLWSAANAALREEKLEVSSDRVRQVSDQVKTFPSDVLKANAIAVQPELEALEKSSPGTQSSMERALMRAAVNAERKRDAVPASLHASMSPVDLIPRTGEVRQDLTDPFLVFIAAHPEHWVELGNKATVNGDGDTEYVLVFENALDGRFKSVSVDPGRVLKARLQIGRKATQAVVASAGIAMGAFGVPMPTGRGAQADQPVAVDYSTMTGEEQFLKSRNAATARLLEKLRFLASSQLTFADADGAERALQAVYRELLALPDDDPASL